ncbi:MAG: flagellar hook-associated protein FlgL [Planctomycetes bacterium]|nr:flagellar hook-associated protein FlgL [Planctomycetota bacterium]
MSFRITQSMLYSRAYTDIQRGLYKYSQLQQQVASGRRVLKPSDDPAAALRILPLRNDLENLKNLSNNVSLARETLDTSTASLEDASSLMQRTRELVTQASNGTLSDGDRDSIGAEVEQLLQQLVGIANSRRGDRFLFGGTANGSPPFDLIEDAGGTRVAYRGNHESLGIDVAPGVSTDLNIPGDGIFLARSRSATTFSAAYGSNATGAAAIGAGDTGVGFGQLQVTFGGLHDDAPGTVSAGSGSSTAVGPLTYTFTSAPDTLSIDGGPALAIPVTDGTFTTADGRTLSLSVTGVAAPTSGTFTAVANLSTDGGATFRAVSDFGANVQVSSSYDRSVLNVDVSGLTRTGTEDVKFGGTFDAFTTLIALRDLLHNDDALPTAQVRDRISQLISEVDGAHDSVLDGLRELGFRSSSMEMLKNRVEGLRTSRTESLSLVQDVDLASAVLDMQQQELSYQAALQVSARIIQNSLSSFLG